MKYSFRLAAALLTMTAINFGRAATAPGFVELGRLTPPGKGAECVEVQVRSNLLGMAALLVEKHEPDAAKLLRSVELVQVKVMGLTAENRESLDQQFTQVRAEIESKAWERNVAVQGKDGEDVAVYTKTRGGEALAGMLVTVKDKKQAVMVNIVGDIRPEQVAKLGEKLNLEPLKKVGEAVQKHQPEQAAEH